MGVNVRKEIEGGVVQTGKRLMNMVPLLGLTGHKPVT
jgi:hypothetical protein